MEIDFEKIEEKWQKRWEEEKIFETEVDEEKEKYYVLEMFPYPSGEGLHMGHAFNFVIGDIFSRFKKMQGYNVLHPIGFDSLGLPAENAAIKAKTNPRDYTNNAIRNFTNQQKKLGLSYDWSRVINTSEPEYYKWDQWIFLKMFEKGLVYEKEAPVNWCSKCNTILANEQVHDGKCWRHEEVEVEVKNIRQLFLKITDYSQRLLEGHEKLNWPEKTISMQKNWIGKSYGTEINFEINGENFPIFTTRPDTIYGVTFLVISAQHKDLDKFVTKENRKEVDKLLKKIRSVSKKSMKKIDELDKEGAFTGSYAINPLTKEKVPIYAGNFVVADYASGMVMAVPAHDQRDFDFAKKYGIKIKKVIEGEVTEKRAFTGEGILINSESFSGMENKKAIEEITKYLEKKKLGSKKIQYKLRDWSIARQRYWGTPIPLVHCDKCNLVPVKEKDLPVKLPENVEFGKGNPLETNKEWINVSCPKCGGNAKRETNTLDTFANSSWYFFRYTDPKNENEIFDKKKVDYWCPADLYIGGAEHACMHLIYSRFYTMFLHDIGLINFEEVTPRLFHQGMINGPDGEKMSKSKGNVVEPLETMSIYGVDSTRFFLMSEASPDKGFNWNDKGIQGSLRIIKKIGKISNEKKFGKDSVKMLEKINKSIKNITEQIENIDYRKSTIELRELFEVIEKEETSKETFEKAIKLLAPFCPHISEELWEKLGNKGFISTASWPEVEEIKIKEEKKDLNYLVIEQINYVLEKNSNAKKIYVYVLPFEISKINKEKVSKEIGKEIEIFAVNDLEKYDPENFSKKTKPGKPAIYLE